MVSHDGTCFALAQLPHSTSPLHFCQGRRSVGAASVCNKEKRSIYIQCGVAGTVRRAPKISAGTTLWYSDDVVKPSKAPQTPYLAILEFKRRRFPPTQSRKGVEPRLVQNPSGLSETGCCTPTSAELSAALVADHACSPAYCPEALTGCTDRVVVRVQYVPRYRTRGAD